jgi:hypothetical protein
VEPRLRYRFDRLDPIEFRRWLALSVGQRLQAMLNARELAVGLIRGQIRKEYPDLSLQALNLKVMEELEQRGKRKIPRF